jgi:hypothetical protein
MFFYNNLELSHEDYLKRDGFGDAKYYTMISTENQNDRAVWLLTPNGLP